MPDNTRRTTTTSAATLSKRHASLNGPREVALPAASLSLPELQQYMPSTSTTPSSCRPPIGPSLRSTTWVDRNSSASLPLPTHVAFYALPPPEPSLEPSPMHQETDDSASTTSSSLASSGERPAQLQQPVTPVERPPRIQSRIPSPDSRDFPEFTAMRRYMVPSHRRSPPEPPIIVDTPANPHGQGAYAPHASFLSHAPPPADCSLTIETAPDAYWLVLCLPGFTWQGITLATKRGRILHVVADKWEGEGGHFERRVKFGHDADLIHVRAEFNGHMLRICIPRRIAPVFS